MSMDGKMFVCSFCYDSTRLDYMRKYGIKKDGLFPYEDFLLGEHMKAEVKIDFYKSSFWSTAD